MAELNNNNHNNTSWLTASVLRRLLFFLGADALIVAFSLFVAFLVHFDFNSNIRYFSLIGEIVLFFVALKLLPVWGAPIKISVLWVEAKDL